MTELFSFLFPFVAYAAEGISPVAAVNKFYLFALSGGGIIGLGALVWAAILIASSGGNASRRGEAKEVVTGAFTGLLLLVMATMILNTIDPNLTILALPNTLPTIEAPDPNNEAACGLPGCSQGTHCETRNGSSVCVEDNPAPPPENTICQPPLPNCGEGQVCTKDPNTGSQYCTSSDPPGLGCRSRATNQIICAAAGTTCQNMYLQYDCKIGSCSPFLECRQ